MLHQCDENPVSSQTRLGSRHAIGLQGHCAQDFTPENLHAHDLVVPLAVSDLRCLDELHDLVDGNPIPIPSLERSAVCDGKLRLNAALIANGFADCVPQLGIFQAYPYILKARIDA